MMKRVGMMVAAVALLVGAGGCGDASVVQPVLDAGAVDVVIDAVGPVDGSSQDAGQDVADGTAIDTGAGLLCEPGDGCFEESCQGAEDCLSGICTMHLGDKVCSKTCDAACPEGWSCTLVGAGGDGQYVCMSNFSHLCLPCGDSSDCSSDVPNACVSYPDELSFCGGACDLETPCPDGYGCQEVAVVGGTQSFQCVPDTNMCICSPLAIASNLSTPCENTNASGTCEGVRACSAEGMTLCDAAIRIVAGVVLPADLTMAPGIVKTLGRRALLCMSVLVIFRGSGRGRKTNAPVETLMLAWSRSFRAGNAIKRRATTRMPAARPASGSACSRVDPERVFLPQQGASS